MATKSPNPASAVGKVLLPIDHRLRELRTLRVATISEIVKLESQGASAEEPPSGESVDQRARKLLDGGEYQVPGAGRDPDHALFELRKELVVIDRALEFGQQRYLHEHGERARQLVVERGDEWRELQHKRVRAILALLSLNRATEDLRRQLRSGGLAPSLPLDGYSARLLGTGEAGTVVSHWALEFVKAAIAAGVVSKKEVDTNV